LLNFSLPNALKDKKRALRVYIDESYEIATDDFWQRNIQPALERSRYLLLVVTEATRLRRSDGSLNWVEKEVSTFLGTAQRGNVLVAMATRDIDGPLPGQLDIEFPRLERLALGELRARATPSL
jgi:hypothetical protein